MKSIPPNQANSTPTPQEGHARQIVEVLVEGEWRDIFTMYPHLFANDAHRFMRWCIRYLRKSGYAVPVPDGATATIRYGGRFYRWTQHAAALISTPVERSLPRTQVQGPSGSRRPRHGQGGGR